jgi:dolichol-phosphate mannosyltransferase
MSSTLMSHNPWARGENAPSTAFSPVVLTVVVPTRNESGNVDELVERIRRALGATGIAYEILFVDDSDDETPEAIAVHVEDGSPVRLLHRRPGTRAGGLGGALCAGFADARGSHALCIDGDLQHPPEILAPMARVLVDGTADVVVGTRYLAGGANDGLDGVWRRFVSVASRDLARCAIPRLRQTTDPGSGLFGFDLRIIDGVDLKPLGYKTLIELLARSNWSSIAEVPYRFGSRAHGRSNASMRQGMQFVRHLAGLRFDRDIRRRPLAASDACEAFGVPTTADGAPGREVAMVVRRSKARDSDNSVRRSVA